MNKRVMLSILGVGVLAIASLLGFCFYKMQGFKHKLQESLNTNLAQISQEVALNELALEYTPFECSGMFFIKCKSDHLTLKSQILNQDIFTSSNLELSLKEIDFGSATLNAKSNLKIADLGDLQEYVEATFPQSFDLDLTIKPQTTTSYTIDTSLKFFAQNAEYTEHFTSLVDSPRVREMGLFAHMSSFAFFQEGLQIKNLEFSLLSKGLSERLFQIAQSKYGKSLNQQAYNTLATFLAAASIETYAKKPYYAQMKDIISAFLGIAIGKAQKMQVFITPKSTTPIQPNTLNTLDQIFANYNFQVKLSK